MGQASKAVHKHPSKLAASGNLSILSADRKFRGAPGSGLVEEGRVFAGLQVIYDIDVAGIGSKSSGFNARW